MAAKRLSIRKPPRQPASGDVRHEALGAVRDLALELERFLLPEQPSALRVALRDLVAQCNRRLGVDGLANASELAWEHADEDQEIPE